MPAPLVLKLGGSLVSTPRFQAIIKLIASANVPVIIVPGGGPFAQAVRHIQPQLELSEALAHSLALLAMHQMGEIIVHHDPRFRTAVTLDDMRAAFKSGHVPIWMPFDLQHKDATLPADWTVTSDALAARLAERLDCTEIGLVKSCAIASNMSLAALAAAGIVDPVFPRVVARARLRWQLYGPDDDERLRLRLTQPGADPVKPKMF